MLDHKSDPEPNLLFAHIDGVKWEGYISRVFSLGLPDLPRVVIMEPAEELHYDEDEHGKPFVLSKDGITFCLFRGILNAVDAVESGALVDRSKYTHGFFAAQMKKVGKLLMPYGTFIVEHPILSAVLGSLLMLAFLYYVTGGDVGGGDGYEVVKTGSKAD